MPDTQIDLFTGQPVPAPRDPAALTGRQQLALEHIAKHQPVASDELGAILHEDRLARGGKGHPADERCEWCPREGRVMGSSLRRHGYVVQKRSLGWCLPDYRPERPGTSGYDPSTSDFPEGF